MNELLALDPSIVSCGVALFRDGVLADCARIVDKQPPMDRGMRALSMAEAIYDWACRRVASLPPPTLVIEWQQVYRAGKSKGDPNDLLGMGFVAGAVAGLLQPAAVLAYKPDEWCKLPKSKKHSEAFTSARGARIMGKLELAERALVPRYHDAVDAVGLGLHALGRLAPRRVYPGCTE
jgi:hypothetical protein